MSRVALLKKSIDGHKLNRDRPVLARLGPTEPFPCEFRGGVIGGRECGPCPGRTELKVYLCTKFKTCDLGQCKECAVRSEPWPRRFDHHNLWPDVPGLRFNPSIIKWGDGYALAVRTGWKGSDILVGRLDRKFAPIGAPVKLDLRHPGANYGREDPRLFVHNNRLHVAFVGVVGTTRLKYCNVMYARLTNDFRVEQIFNPDIPGRRFGQWEKNHSYFSHDGKLYAIYTVDPEHRIMEVDGERVRFVHSQKNPAPYFHGERRGGASPIRVRDEYWHFVHSRSERGPIRQYHTTLYAFAARPPFAITRALPVPLASARMTDKPPDQYCHVHWTAGAVRSTPDEWVLSVGIHDRWTELERYNHNMLNDRLRGVTMFDPLPSDLDEKVKSVTALHGWCPENKAQDTAAQIIAHRPELVAEVGVYGGRWAIAAAEALRFNGIGRIAAIDPWTNDAVMEGGAAEGEHEWWKTTDLEEIYRSFTSAVEERGLTPIVDVYRARSEDAVSKFADESIDVIHIDGNHSEEVSTRDVRLWLPKVKRGGFVWFDDSGWNTTQRALALVRDQCAEVKDYGHFALFQKR